MNWWLIVVAVVMTFTVLGISVYLILMYQAEEDSGTAWFPKIVCMMGLTLAMLTVLLLPYDVANRKDPASMDDLGKGVDTALLWIILLWAVIAFVLLIIPFATFYYEAYDPDNFSFTQQIAPAIAYTMAVFLLFATFTLVFWLAIGYVDIKYYSYQGVAQGRLVYDEDMLYFVSKTVETLSMKASLFVYTVATLAGVGWFLFFIYGGVGLPGFPMDVFSEFINRPKPITEAEYVRETEIVAARAQKLLDLGKQITEIQRKKNTTALRNKINLFRNEVYMMEKKYNRLVIAFKEQGGSPFVVFGMLILALFGLLLSVMWILHIFIYNTAGAALFLNGLLEELDNAFSLLGVLVYAVFSFYLLICTVNGCIRVGLRIVFFQIHPMKVHDTTMNALLFNVGLVLLCSVSVTQFCAMSFKDYASNTAVDTLLNAYVRKLRYIGPLITYMQYAFVAVAVFSIFWLLICPRARKKDDDDDMDMDDK